MIARIGFMQGPHHECASALSLDAQLIGLTSTSTFLIQALGYVDDLPHLLNTG